MAKAVFIPPAELVVFLRLSTQENALTEKTVSAEMIGRTSQ